MGSGALHFHVVEQTVSPATSEKLSFGRTLYISWERELHKNTSYRSDDIVWHEKEESDKWLSKNKKLYKNNKLSDIIAILSLSPLQTLSPEQLDLLIQNTSSMNPLWLSLACEELRVFGVFETLTKKIAGFPNTLQGLLGSIIQRLVLEDQVDKVKELLCLLYCCPEGVAERDLRGALSELEGGAQLPSMHWATLRRTLSCLLRVGRDHRGRDTLGFFHGSVAKAVEQCFLGSEGARQPYLCSLADYYESRCTDDFSVVLQVPRLLREAKLHARLVQFLRKDRRALSIPAHTRVQYLKVTV
ncbi:uncharacterized protein LOC128647029 [Bombina bombina]|uniref:uncharacterized protein LOC128647029 n=1 Tax=Bombina bombina TaxID=8345 RepID=UPI00235B22A5|nr:uncharacterized protein LOC128647029 [Bombina bombina]